MFAPDDRTHLRDELLERARHDTSVAGAALVGSGATGREDDWSDIDLALQVTVDGDVDAVVAEWTRAMYADHEAAHHFDVRTDDALYRVFLLRSSLQVDLSFWPHDRFRATQDGFSVVFGTANPPTEHPPADPDPIIGFAWLIALHARSAIARGRAWQAQIMLDDLRDQVIRLMCLRCGESPHDGRGVDRLPEAELGRLDAARAQSLEPEAQAMALGRLLSMLGDEAETVDPETARALREPLQVLSNPLD